jgi:hypothetical protein
MRGTDRVELLLGDESAGREPARTLEVEPGPVGRGLGEGDVGLSGRRGGPAASSSSARPTSTATRAAARVARACWRRLSVLSRASGTSERAPCASAVTMATAARACSTRI